MRCDGRTRFLTLLLCVSLALGFSVAQAATDLVSEFLPHGVCYTWNKDLIWLHLIADSLIGVAYFSIPFALVYFVRRRQDLPFRWIFVLFGVFIIACGSTHLMEVWTLWYPYYWISGAVKAITAAASIPTAIALLFLIPHALTIPGAGQLREMNESLAQEVAQRQRSEEKLRAAQMELEAQVMERTRDLANANRELQSQGESLQATLSERIRAEQDLRDADRRKDEFLATLAHELRNPLSPIRSAVALIQRQGSPDARLRELSDIIDRQAKHMTRLLEDLMDASRITRNRIELRKERLDFSTVVAAALETCTPLIEAKGHTLKVTLPDSPLELEADSTRMAQILANLLSNAAKYTDPGGTISLSVVRDGNNIRISIRDNGIGIERDHLPRLFEMFSQAASALDRSGGGLGIGLALVRGLVEAHGGRVEAHSQGLGAGSEFVVYLPLFAPDRALVTSHGGMVTSPAPSRPLHVLVAEDNADAANALAALLALSGHGVKIVSDGVSVVEEARVFRPEVAILDIGLPGLNGYEVAERIRTESWGSTLPLIALTGWGQEDDKRRAKEAGFDHHFTKPIDFSTLEKLLASIGAAPSRG